MSNASAFSTPASRATRAAPTTPAAGPERSSAAGRASSIVTSPPAEVITSGSRLAEPVEVARDERAEVGVCRGRRGALVFAELWRNLA